MSVTIRPTSPEEVEALRQHVIDRCVFVLREQLPDLTPEHLERLLRPLIRQVYGWSVEELVTRVENTPRPAVTH